MKKNQSDETEPAAAVAWADLLAHPFTRIGFMLVLLDGILCQFDFFYRSSLRFWCSLLLPSGFVSLAGFVQVLAYLRAESNERKRAREDVEPLDRDV